MTGQHVRQSKDLSGQYPILTGHCPLTGRYLQPWSLETLPAKIECIILKSGRCSDLVVGTPDSELRGPGSSPGQVIVLCSWARHFTLTMPLSTQEYK